MKSYKVFFLIVAFLHKHTTKRNDLNKINYVKNLFDKNKEHE